MNPTDASELIACGSDFRDAPDHGDHVDDRLRNQSRNSGASYVLDGTYEVAAQDGLDSTSLGFEPQRPLGIVGTHHDGIVSHLSIVPLFGRPTDSAALLGDTRGASFGDPRSGAPRLVGSVRSELSQDHARCVERRQGTRQTPALIRDGVTGGRVTESLAWPESSLSFGQRCAAMFLLSTGNCQLSLRALLGRSRASWTTGHLRLPMATTYRSLYLRPQKPKQPGGTIWHIDKHNAVVENGSMSGTTCQCVRSNAIIIGRPSPVTTWSLQ